MLWQPDGPADPLRRWRELFWPSYEWLWDEIRRFCGRFDVTYAVTLQHFTYLFPEGAKSLFLTTIHKESFVMKKCTSHKRLWFPKIPWTPSGAQEWSGK
jgi:hypothetical protein